MSKLKSVFQNKTVLVTGHTGFKGSWLIYWLNMLGAKVIGISLDSVSLPSHYVEASMEKDVESYHEDIRDLNAIEKIFLTSKPDFVFHLAAQALVKKSYSDTIETWTTNVIGTLNILEALRKLQKKCAVVIITSDKCYENVEWVWGYRETDALGGYDPYSASKGAAELVIRSHVKSFFDKNSSLVSIVSARAGNVIGGGDWGSDRIVPDCVKAWSTGIEVNLRSPHATRPWQHVLEPLSGYLSLASELYANPNLHGESFNFGPPSNQNQSVLELVETMAKYWKQVKWVDKSDIYKGPYESGLLKLNCDKALHYLKWKTTLDFEATVKMTAEWYGTYYSRKENAALITKQQIEEYTQSAKSQNILWAL